MRSWVQTPVLPNKQNKQTKEIVHKVQEHGT
jgi:hypothetical protein